jgi:hypothetical protein
LSVAFGIPYDQFHHYLMNNVVAVEATKQPEVQK